MKKRSLMKMCSLLCLAGLLALAAAAGPCFAGGTAAPEQPYLLNAALSVNGVPLSGVNAAYQIGVTDTSGNKLYDEYSCPTQTGCTATIPFGEVTGGRFEYQIPMTLNSTTGAVTPANACIAVYYNDALLPLSYPAQGKCPNAGTGEIKGLTAGDSTGFGLNPDGSQIEGEPNNSTHTFSSPLAAVWVSVACGGKTVNSSNPESFGSVPLGQSKNITTCVIDNPSAVSQSITGLTTSTCAFSIVSPLQAALPLSIASGKTQAMTLAFAPCGVGGVETDTLTISNSNGLSYGVALTGTGVPSISLTSGWNLIGLPVEPTNTAVNTVLSDDLSVPASDVVVIWAYINGQWSYYDPNDVAGSGLTTLTTGNGYWIYMTSKATLTIQAVSGF